MKYFILIFLALGLSFSCTAGSGSGSNEPSDLNRVIGKMVDLEAALRDAVSTEGNDYTGNNFLGNLSKQSSASLAQNGSVTTAGDTPGNTVDIFTLAKSGDGTSYTITFTGDAAQAIAGELPTIVALISAAVAAEENSIEFAGSTFWITRDGSSVILTQGAGEEAIKFMEIKPGLDGVSIVATINKALLHQIAGISKDLI